MSEAIRKVLESQQPAAKAVNGVPAAAPQISSANDTPEKAVKESAKADESLDDEAQAQAAAQDEPETEEEESPESAAEAGEE